MLTIAARLGTILSTLRQAVAAFAARENRVQPLVWLGAIAYSPLIPPNQPPRIAPETWNLLINRLGRTAARFTALFARWRAGTLPMPSPPRPDRVRTPHPIPRLPATRGWLARSTDHHVRGHVSQLQNLLAEPDMAEFVTGVPRAARLLRPLTHALALTEPTWLKRAPKPSFSPLALGRGEPEGGSSTPLQGTPFRPLPANIRAAARAWKKYDQ